MSNLRHAAEAVVEMRDMGYIECLTTAAAQSLSNLGYAMSEPDPVQDNGYRRETFRESIVLKRLHGTCPEPVGGSEE